MTTTIFWHTHYVTCTGAHNNYYQVKAGNEVVAILQDKIHQTNLVLEAQTANADFIVKACNNHAALLSACEIALVRLESGSTKEQEFNRGVAEVLRKALNQAKGE